MSENRNEHIFSIDKKTNPETEHPFGKEYSGNFKVRRPTILDKRNIALMDQASLNTFGVIDQTQVNGDVVNFNYIFSFIEVAAEEKPDWFDQSKLFDDGADGQAVIAVWAEVQEFLDRFRSKKGSGVSGEGKQNP